MSQPTYHFGFDTLTREFILWKKDHKDPVCRIPLENGLSLVETIVHILNVERESL